MIGNENTAVAGAVLALKNFVSSTQYSKRLANRASLISYFERADDYSKEVFLRHVLSLRPYAYPSVWQLLIDLSDAIPHPLLEMVVTWCNLFYESRARDRFSPRPSEVINIWTDILEKSIYSSKLCAQLRRFFIEAADDPLVLLGDSLQSIYRYLVVADDTEYNAVVKVLINHSSQIAEHMVAQRWRVIFYSLTARSHSDPELISWLERHASDELQARIIGQFVLRKTSGDSTVDPSTKTWAIERITNFLNVVTDPLRTGFGNSVGLSSELIEQLNWAEEDKPLFDRLLVAILAPLATIGDVRQCFQLARFVLKSNPSVFAPICLARLMQFLSNPPTVRDFLLRSENQHQEQQALWEDLIATVAILVEVDPSQSIPALRPWLSENYIHAPISAAGSLLRSAIIIGCVGSKVEGGFTHHEELSIANILLERCIVGSSHEAIGSVGLVSYIEELCRLFKNEQVGSFVFEKDSSYAMRSLCESLARRSRELVGHADVKVRISLAYLAVVWRQSPFGEELGFLEDWIDTLQNDPRGRVRSVFTSVS